MSEKKGVVAVNSRGDVVGSYESICEAARVNGFDTAGISRSISRGVIYKRLKWMLETEYRDLWFAHKTDSLYYNIRQLRSDSSRKRWLNASQEKRNEWRKNMSLSAKKKIRECPEVYEACRRAHLKPILCTTTGEMFESAIEFGKAYNADPRVVRTAACKGYKVWRKYAVKYISKEDYEEKNRNQEKDRRNPD